MEGSDILWAQQTLQERKEELEHALQVLRRRVDTDPTIISDMEKEYEHLVRRSSDLIQSINEGKDPDLYYEFELLCWQIRSLQRQRLHSLFNDGIVQGTLSATSVVLANIARCVVGVELAFVAMVGSLVTTNAVRLTWSAEVSKIRTKRNDILAEKMKIMSEVLRDQNDIRYVCSAIETVGLPKFQKMRDD